VNTITVNALPTVNAGADDAACINTNISLNASVTGGIVPATPYSYAWSPSTSLSDGTIEDPIFNSANPVTGVTYTLSVTDKNGCKGGDVVALTANGLPPITASALPTAVCSGFSSVLTAGGGSTYSWSTLATGTSISITPSGTTTYFVTGTDGNGCKNTATTSVIFNAIPSVSVSVPTLNSSTGNYCVSNTTSIAITTNPSSVGIVAVTGTGVSGTAPNFTFTPSTATAGGPYTLTFNYTDVNGCKNSTTTTATVYALPAVIWAGTNPTLACIDGSAVNLDVTTTPSGGTGTFTLIPGLSKTNDTKASFDPKTAGAAGSKVLDYTYTDLHGCVKAAASSSIMVFDTPEPTVQSINTMSTPLPASFCFDVTSQNLTNVQWYLDPKTTVQGTGNTYCPVIQHTNTSPYSLKEGTTKYLYSQSINGCESQLIEAEAIVINCPAKAPQAGIDPKPCTKPSLGTPISATALGGGDLVWFTGSNTKTATHLATGTSYTVTTSAAGSTVVYVAEWHVGKACFGPTSPVVLTVNTLPTPTISAIPSVCYTSGIQTLTVSHLSGAVLKGTGASSPNKFDPTAGGKTDGSYKLTYVVTDNNLCVDSTTITMTVTYADVPVAVVRVPYLQTDIPPLGTTIPKVCATAGLGSGTGVEWAKDAAFFIEHSRCHRLVL
jgi:hypothetical protein